MSGAVPQPAGRMRRAGVRWSGGRLRWLTRRGCARGGRGGGGRRRQDTECRAGNPDPASGTAGLVLRQPAALQVAVDRLFREASEACELSGREVDF